MILKENKDIEDYKNDIKESLKLISKIIILMGLFKGICIRIFQLMFWD